MNAENLTVRRLTNLQIAHQSPLQPAEVVASLGAMQAQDYAGGLWAIGLRADVTESDVIQAIAAHKIVRSWPMRGTLHFVAAKDVHWMLELLAPRQLASAATRRANLALDEKILAKAATLLGDALAGGKQLARTTLLQILDDAGIATANQRGYHILLNLSQKGFLCFGLHEGKQPTFALLDEWVPDHQALTRDEALVELATRYFCSHGPATVQDLMRWAGVTAADAKQGVLQAQQLASEKINGQEYWRALHEQEVEVSPPRAYLLPGFDEYMLGYKDRSFALEVAHAHKIVPGNNGMFLPTIVIGGRVVGTWKRTMTTKALSIQLSPFTPLSVSQLKAVRAAAEALGTFYSLPITIA